MTFGLILIGLIGLWAGTKFIIDAALGMAKRFNLSHSFVGVAILAVGTDLPEVFVTLKASVSHLQGVESSGIITGNAIGSCMSQITLILGIAGLLLSFHITKRDLIRDGIALLGSIILLFFFGIDRHINRWEGVGMLVIYILYYIVLMKNHVNQDDDNSKGKDYSNTMMLLLLLIGFIILVFSSHLVVDNAMDLAAKWGVEQSFVGIVLIGIGTSLPELAVSVGAALRKAPGMSVGNVIGSNIFDGLIPIGLGGAISTTSIESNLLTTDIPILFIFTLIVLLFLRTKRGISTIEGIILIVMFLIYLFVKFITL